MIKHKTHIADCFWMQPKIFEDHRGIFSEIFKNSTTQSAFKPLQSNYSYSKKGTLRGIHKTPYAKYVTCVKGAVYDVCVDLRPNSKTYNQYFAIQLNEVVLNSLYIPPFCGHAFLALENSVLIYQQDEEYKPELDETLCYNSYNISWPMSPKLISDKDKRECNE